MGDRDSNSWEYAFNKEHTFFCPPTGHVLSPNTKIVPFTRELAYHMNSLNMNSNQYRSWLQNCGEQYLKKKEQYDNDIKKMDELEEKSKTNKKLKRLYSTRKKQFDKKYNQEFINKVNNKEFNKNCNKITNGTNLLRELSFTTNSGEIVIPHCDEKSRPEAKSVVNILELDHTNLNDDWMKNVGIHTECYAEEDDTCDVQYHEHDGQYENIYVKDHKHH